ncbi:MAG: GNAT family N-acetyltransferase, partial [Gammaproteobacteria bacterium]
MHTQEQTVYIRPAQPSDIDALVAFNAAMARETEDKALDPAVLHAGIAAVLADPARGFYLVAECAGAIAGCLMITHEWSVWRNGDWWWIQSVYVDPACRRRGVYRALHAETERRARATPEVIGLRLYVERDNAHA